MNTVSYDVQSAEKASRVELFVRIIWGIISLIVMSILGIIAYICYVLEWLAILITGKRVSALDGMLKTFVTYNAQMTSYMSLLTDERNPIMPSSSASMNTLKYSVNSSVNASRIELIIRFIWSIPTSIVLSILSIIAYVCYVLQWIAILILGKRIMALNGVIKALVKYSVLYTTYFFLVTDERSPLIPG
jgi:hypothetical protein